MDKLVYLYYPILLVVLLWGSRVYKFKTWNEECFSLSQTKAVQAFFALCIMFHHISQNTCANVYAPKHAEHGLDIFIGSGFLFVGIFLFCSGYGLYKSYKTKPHYLDGFLRRRALPIVLSYYITGIIFLFVRAFMGQKITLPYFIYYITGLKLSNPNAWFVIALPIFYLGFYLSFKYCKKESSAVFFTCLTVFIYTLIGTCCDHNDWWMCGQWWYNSVHMFCIGLLFARNEKKIVDHIKRYEWRYFLYLLLALVLVYVCVPLANYTQNHFSYYGEDYHLKYKVLRRWVCLLVEMVECGAFSSFVFLLGFKLKLGNKVLAFIGGITMELYLIHGIFVELFGYSFLDFLPSLYHIKNAALYVTVVIILSIPSALLLKKILNLFRVKKSANQEKEQLRKGA